MLTDLPTAATIRHLLPRDADSWQNVGRLHFTCIPGDHLGLRRFSTVLVAIETSDGPALAQDVLSQSLLDVVAKLDNSNPDEDVGVLLCVADRSLWGGFSATFVNIAIADLDSILAPCTTSPMVRLRRGFLQNASQQAVNPYDWVGRCRDTMFFGREDVIKQILRSPRSSFAVVGPRQIGKTSLLRILRKRLLSFPGQSYCYINCGAIPHDHSIVQSLAHTILQSISPRASYYHAGKEDIEAALISAASRQKSRYLVALDEFDSIARCSEADLGRLRGWLDSGFRGRLRFVIAGYSRLWERIEDNCSYLFNSVPTIELGRFSDQDAKEFVETTLSELDVAVAHSSKAVSLLLRYSGRQPWLLQALCSKTLECFFKNRSTEPLEIVEEVANSDDIRQLVFQSTAMNCTPIGNAILACIASYGSQDEQSILEAFRKTAPGFPPERIIKELRVLKMAGAIDQSHKKIEVTSELLSQYVKRFWSFERAVLSLEGQSSRLRDENHMSDSREIRSPRPDAARLFYSYSHKDEPLRNDLDTHLALLKRNGRIKPWHDRCITAGREWVGQIDEHLKAADIVLLLVSADFLASDYCYDIEMKCALQRHEDRKAIVIPVILRACDWSVAPFSKLQALPPDAVPVTSWKNPDEAFTKVALGIRRAIDARDTQA